MTRSMNHSTSRCIFGTLRAAAAVSLALVATPGRSADHTDSVSTQRGAMSAGKMAPDLGTYDITATTRDGKTMKRSVKVAAQGQTTERFLWSASEVVGAKAR